MIVAIRTYMVLGQATRVRNKAVSVDLREEECIVDGEHHLRADRVNRIINDAAPGLTGTFTACTLCCRHTFLIGIGQQRPRVGEQHFMGNSLNVFL